VWSGHSCPLPLPLLLVLVMPLQLLLVLPLPLHLILYAGCVVTGLTPVLLVTACSDAADPHHHTTIARY
jgi:hypothetical protein